MSNNYQQNYHNKKFFAVSKGFTLIEVLTALTIVMVGILGAFGLVNQTIAASKTASMQLTAAYLGKEGIEIVKNIRDSNYLKSHYSETGYGQESSWMSGLALAGNPISVDCSAGCDADYSMGSLNRNYAGQPLNFNGHFFNHAPVNPAANPATPYRRSITVIPRADFLEISVRIDWNEHGRNRSIVVQENLYNWWLQ